MKNLIIALSAATLMGATASVQASGEDTYKTACMACHDTGAANAPKITDKAAWKDRIATGMDKMYSNAIKGYKGSKGVMPPKGGRADLSDDAVKAAVDYMVAKAK